MTQPNIGAEQRARPGEPLRDDAQKDAIAHRHPHKRGAYRERRIAPGNTIPNYGARRTSGFKCGCGIVFRSKQRIDYSILLFLSGTRCRIRILKSLYISCITKERFRCTMLWRCAKSIGLLAVVSAFQYEGKDTFFGNITLLSLYFCNKPVISVSEYTPLIRL